VKAQTISAVLIAFVIAFGYPRPGCGLNIRLTPSDGHRLLLGKRYERLYQKAWQLVKDNYCDRDKLSHWDSWQHRFDGQIHTKEQLSSSIKAMLASLHDEYTYLLSPGDIDQRRREHKCRAVVSSAMLPHNIGYLKVSSFCSASMVSEFHRAMHELSGADGYVLDLRNNHGGFIQLADDLFAMLADKGTFLFYEGRHDGQPDDEQFALDSDAWQVAANGRITRQLREHNLSAGKPLVVLVNEDTRSAAELLAGSLRDNGRALVVGTQTFGKGVLQDSYSLGDGLEMKVVTAKYFLPDGINIHKRGLSPDVVVKQKSSVGANKHTDCQLQQAQAIVQLVVAQQATGGQAVANAGERRTE
jgi:C-terminal processing protease CtpA/Prc